LLRESLAGSPCGSSRLGRLRTDGNLESTAVARYEPVDPAQSFPALEEGVLARWRERDIFSESIRRREGSPPFVFYEGPPTANGRPGVHLVLSRVF
jgi:isoleucyl-tRNA synthetase